MSASRVVVVGSVNVDLVVATATLPAPGETVTGGRFARHGGGKGANQAVAAARLGASVALVGAVGADDLGEAARAALEAEGIDCSALATLEDEPTGVAAIVVDADGENLIAVASGANAALTGARVEAALETLLAAPDGAAGSGRATAGAGRPPGVVLLGFEVGDDAVEAGARAAAAAGWPIVLNPAPARPLPPGVAGCEPILTPNQGEAARLAGDVDLGPEEAAESLAALTGAPVVVTLGARGSLLWRDGTAERLPTEPVDVVDTTGAGDAFNGALAAELAGGASLADAVALAQRAAARSTTKAGAREGMPSRAELA